MTSPTKPRLSLVTSNFNRDSLTNRNVSSPFSLAIPGRNSKRSSRPVSIPLSIRPASSVYSQDQDDLEDKDKITPLKPAVIVAERPTRPHPENRQSRALAAYYRQCRLQSVEKKRNFYVSCWRINDRVLALSVTFTLAVLVMLGVPLIAVIAQKFVVQLPVNVIVPSHSFREAGSWNRLYDAIIQHQDVKFTVIINPDDGPGNGTRPSPEFVGVLNTLEVYPHVQTLGYIHTDRGSRSSATVRAEIARYSGWSKFQDLRLDGIFFDQTPYRDGDSAREYLRNISATVRHSEGFSEPKLVVHNPGCIPDVGLLRYRTDIVVMFEGTYADLPGREQLKHSVARLEQHNLHRQNFGMMINSMPSKTGDIRLRRVVDNVRRSIEWLYITDLTDNVYAGYGSLLEQWLNLIW
ncbi:Spherulation-specific family 4-domain-containing protein [Boeremia exigua]|uniref:Spherulation-specific family 4-domain-containing protein n=1 Tax=Boeremia exigua TaxID=749465 RepID=UPI001E8DDF40|nr:Spherulation-specific family 4-domain-containing protein [Boeremia exigua]KAH6614019.1 Spherulation-specific family 4-domain-containing protein [Boeremia exigua]